MDRSIALHDLLITRREINPVRSGVFVMLINEEKVEVKVRRMQGDIADSFDLRSAARRLI